MPRFARALPLFLLIIACTNDRQHQPRFPQRLETRDNRYPEETHLRNVRQLTFGGDNAEAYWSFDGTMITLQRTFEPDSFFCDQIFWGKVPGESDSVFILNQLSNGYGRTTCSYFLQGDDRILFASTHESDSACPPQPDFAKLRKYVWPVYRDYEIYVASLDGEIVEKLTDNAFYDAEATVSPKGDKIVFTSDRSGDLELWTMNIDGSNPTQITHDLGYDGGAFFSPDGSKIVFRASRPKDSAAMEYRQLLAQGLVAPGELEIFVCNADGSALQQVTNLGNANWAPFFHPSGEKIIFTSNHKSGGRTFNLFMINLDGTGLEQITYDPQFDAFPMFSPDGKKVLFSSNRNNGGTRETNVFVADWIE